MSVEANLLAKRARMKTEKKVTIKEEASSLYFKADNILQKIEKMFDQLKIADKPKQQSKIPTLEDSNNPNSGLNKGSRRQNINHHNSRPKLLCNKTMYME